MGLQALQLGRGEPMRAAATIDAFVARWGAGASLFLLDGAFVPELVERARMVARSDSARYGATFSGATYARRLWELGLLEARTGSAELAATIASHLQRLGASPDSSYARDRAQSLAAFVTLARGDSAGAERALRDLITTASVGELSQWDEAAPLAAERLTLARLLHARGAFQEAIDVASVLDGRLHLIHLLYLAPSLELRAQAAKSLGNTLLESQYRARLTTLRAGDCCRG